MTDIVELLRQRAARKWTDVADRSASLFWQAADEIERLRAARGEPVAWVRQDWSGTGSKSLTFEPPPSVPSVRDELVNPIWTPLYAAPPRRKPLTTQQIWTAVEEGIVGGIGFPSKAVAVARAIERAHGIGDE